MLTPRRGVVAAASAAALAHFEGGTSGDVDCGSSSLSGTIGTDPNTPSVLGSLWP